MLTWLMWTCRIFLGRTLHAVRRTASDRCRLTGVSLFGVFEVKLQGE